MNKSTVPPRFVPTLTEVVSPIPSAGLQPLSEAATVSAQAPQVGHSQEELVRQVLLKIEVTLERRLRELVGQMVLEQSHALLPALRLEIEALVREAAAQLIKQDSIAR